MKRSRETWIACALVIFSWCELLSAAETTRIAYPSAAVTFVPLWVAKEAGFLKKENLPIELVSIRSSPIAMAALLSGDLDMIVGGVNPAIAMQLQGYKDITVFGGLINTFLFSICSLPEIEDVSQLKGKKLGVTRFGGSNDFAGRYYLRQRGLDPNKDVTLIQVGSQEDILRALLSKNLDAAVLGYPAVFIAKKNGLRELADLTRSGLRYQLTGFVAKKSFLAEKQSLVTRYFKVMAQSIHFLHARPKEGMEIMRRYARIDDPEILKASYDLHLRLFPKTPDVHPEDLKLVLEEIAIANPKAKGADPGSFMDDRIVREVAKSGFVEQLYK
jgi:NitT/TauT family transport system substrate-binding protein